MGSAPIVTTVTSRPRLHIASAISMPMEPPPMISARRVPSPSASRPASSAAPSSRVWTPYTPTASMPGAGGRSGLAPAASTRWS